MGFFFENEAADLFLKGVKPKTKRVEQSLTTERGCEACPLRAQWPRLTSPRMSPTGITKNATILVLGEGPDENEDREGRPFVGKAGSLIRDHIPGRFMDETAFATVTRCHSGVVRMPTPQEMHACSIHLEDDIQKMPKLRAILGVGQAPLSKFMNETHIGNIHGNRFPVQIGNRVLWYYPVMHPSYVLSMQSDKGYEGAAMPVFRANMQRFFREVEDWGKPRIPTLTPDMVVVPTSYEQARDLVAQMEEPVGVDLETSSPHEGVVPKPYHKGARILSASISDGKTTIAFPINGPKAKTEWGLRLLVETVCKYVWIAHNAAYELIWFLAISAGKQLQPFEDSMALVRLYHANERITGLGIASRIHLGVNVKKFNNVDASRLWEYSIDDVLQYNGFDSYASAIIWRKLYEQVNHDHYYELLDRIRSFAHMERLGLPVDRDQANAIHKQWQSIAHRSQQEANKLYEVREFVRQFSKEFNIGSGYDVGDALVKFGKVPLPPTKGGGRFGRVQYSTDDTVLTSLAPDNPLVKRVLEYREATKLDSTYALPLVDLPTHTTDGLLHPSYSVLLVSTYRSSSEDPNAQNFPKRKHRELRRPVAAPPGHVYVACDFGQMQVRILAMASEDEILVDALLSGRDIHTDWLNRLLEVEPSYWDHLASKTGESDEAKLRKVGRTLIKSDFVFNSFFGGGAENIAMRTGIPVKKAVALQTEFWAEFAGVKAWHKKRRNEYRDTGTVKGLTGIVLGRTIKTGNEPINFPIQNGEAEIVMRAQNELSQIALEENDMYLHPRINIHDDLSFIMPDDDRLPDYLDRVTKIMVKQRFDWQIVPSVVEVSVGPNWCDLEEIAVIAGDYTR